MSVFGSEPAQSAPCAIPNTIANGQPNDASALMADLNAISSCIDSAGPGGSTNSVQIKGSSGTLSGVGPLTNGQILVGSTGAGPVAQTLTAGAGVSITNTAGTITLKAAPGGSTNAVQIKNATEGFSAVGPLTNGQLIIGSTGNAPTTGVITAGAGIAVANSAGGITVSATGPGPTSTLPDRAFGAFAPPDSSTFTVIDSFTGLTPTVTNVAKVGLVYSTPITNNTLAVAGAYRAVPTSSSWTLTFRAKYGGLPGGDPQFGAFVKDSSGKMLGVILASTLLIVRRNNSNISFNSNVLEVGVRALPNWFRINYDGTNINLSTSWDGQNWMIAWTEAKTAFLNGTLQSVGFGGISAIGNTNLWRPGSNTGAVITYWDIDDDPASGRTQ